MTAAAHAQPTASGFLVQIRPAQEVTASETSSASRQRSTLSAASRLQLDQAAGIPAADGGGRAVIALPQPLSGDALRQAQAELGQDPRIQHIEPDVRIPLAATPNDPLWSRQWEMAAPMSQLPAAIDALAAWDIAPTSNVVVAILDSGVLPDHPDLRGALLPGYDFVSLDPTFGAVYANDGDGRDSDPSDPGDWVLASESSITGGAFEGCPVGNSTWHGTAIAGQIGAVRGDGYGVAGLLGPTPRILPVRVSGRCGGLLSDVLDGMRWAAGLRVQGVPDNPYPARVINLSMGGDVACTPIVQNVIREVTNAGALVVVAAGNQEGTGGVQPQRPADCQGVVAVGAVQRSGLKTGYSRLGQAVTLAAPGGEVNDGLFLIGNSGQTTPQLNGYVYAAGTSFAAPLVSGTAALMLAAAPQLTPTQLASMLQSSSRTHIAGTSSCSATSNFRSCFCTTATCGAGLLDAGQAVKAAHDTTLVAPPSGGTDSGGSGGGGGGSLALGMALALAALLALRGLLRRATPAGPRGSQRDGHGLPGAGR